MDKVLNQDAFEILLAKAFVQYEKEQQKAYPDVEELKNEYPTSKRKLRKYKRIAKEKENGKKSIRIYMSRAAVVFLCIISLLFGLIMTNSEVRASVENVILKWYDKYTEFVFNEASGIFSSHKPEDFEIGYIPEGFELQFENVFDGTRDLYYINSKKDDAVVFIQIFDITTTSVCVDNEKMLYKKIKIGSVDAWLMYNEDEQYGSLIVAYDEISILISGDLSIEEIIKVAENIK